MTFWLHCLRDSLAVHLTQQRQQQMFRWLMGGYLLLHFAQLYSSGPELFSHEGMLQADASPFHVLGLPLFFFDSPWMIHCVLGGAVLLSGLLLLGRLDRIAAACLWLILANLTTRNPLINNPSLPYIGWLLLAHAVVGWNHPRFDQQLKRAAWIVMAAGYTYSGVTKWFSPSWADGSALEAVLQNPLARDNLLRLGLLEAPGPAPIDDVWGTCARDTFRSAGLLSTHACTGLERDGDGSLGHSLSRRLR